MPDFVPEDSLPACHGQGREARSTTFVAWRLQLLEVLSYLGDTWRQCAHEIDLVSI